MTKLIIFDWDGVIIDSTTARYACYRFALSSVGKKVSDEWISEKLAPHVGSGSHNELKGILGDEQHLYDQARAAYNEYRERPEFMKQVKLFDGLQDALQKLKEKYVLAVATGGRRKYLEHYFKHFNLKYFTYTMAIEDVVNEKHVKPAPFMLNVIMNKARMSKEETIYIGDARNDVEMAFNAEVTPVVVLSGQLTKQEAKDLGVTHIIPDVTHLEKILQ